jgi:hypothetical protein
LEAGDNTTKGNAVSKVPEVSAQTVTTRAQAQDLAQDWQQHEAMDPMSYGEMSEWQSVFEQLGERFDLTEEFRENGIIS